MDSLDINVIDSHTGGEPTRTVVGGFPEAVLSQPDINARKRIFDESYRILQRGLICEPRGFAAIVGALICPPDNRDSQAGVIFFNNDGFIQMCGHGTIGVVKTLEFLGQLVSNRVRLDTLVGTVEALINEDGSVSVTNVESYRFRKNVSVQVEGIGIVTGDIAWGGNWFFLIKDHGLAVSMDNLEDLTIFTKRVLKTLQQEGITGANGEKIDHVEVFADSDVADSRNYVLCPGGEYDRSPCGTGTSAKIACLADDGLLAEGDTWRQQSITGSIFEATYTKTENGIIPSITGSAYVTSRSTLIFSKEDPFRFGIK